MGVGRFLKAGGAAALMRSDDAVRHRDVPEESHASTPFSPNRLMSTGSQNKTYS